MSSAHHEDNPISHVAAAKVLLVTGGTLLVLTLLTVLATRVDFGANINLAVAIVSALCAASLFVGFTLMDSSQYQNTNIWDPTAPPPAPVGPRPTG
jgi:hypothetical protein